MNQILEAARRVDEQTAERLATALRPLGPKDAVGALIAMSSSIIAHCASHEWKDWVSEAEGALVVLTAFHPIPREHSRRRLAASAADPINLAGSGPVPIEPREG